jgi:outer membrane receptor protein involved in Fe transport
MHSRAYSWPGFVRTLPAVILMVAASAVGPAWSQEPPAEVSVQDTVSFDLDAVIVTADRRPIRLANATSSVAVLRRAELQRLRVRSLPDALETVPGVTIVDFDGAGGDPQLILRGFYGGGEAEYVLVLLDGVPLNNLRNGRINWNLVPTVASGSVEIVRGGASSLWGDAAMAGVVNVISQDVAERRTQMNAMGGQLGTAEVSVLSSGALWNRQATGWAALRRSNGFRDDTGSYHGTAGGSLSLLDRPGGSLTLSTLHHFGHARHPGPITEDRLHESRTGVLPMFRFDQGTSRLHRAGIHWRSSRVGRLHRSGYVVGETTDEASVRTLPLSPTFADTKDHLVKSRRVLSAGQVRLEHGGAAFTGSLTTGLDLSVGVLESTYFHVISGGPATYLAAEHVRGDLVADGIGHLVTAAAFVRYQAELHQRLHLTIGGRFDRIAQEFKPSGSDTDRLSSTSAAFSPELGANLALHRSARHRTNVLGSIGRSFKAPTHDQLFDQRPIPIPFPPNAATVSNPSLSPQYGWHYEVGGYHQSDLTESGVRAEVSFSAYEIHLTDQLDFDLERFHYINLGSSLHRGAEVGLKAHSTLGVAPFFTYSLQRATDRSGIYSGRFLKAIPRDSRTVGVDVTSRTGPSATFVSRRTGSSFMDDANTIRLPGFSRLDARVRYPVGPIDIAVEITNLLNRSYQSTGYPDPAGSGVLYVFPAAGRTARLGMSTAW